MKKTAYALAFAAALPAAAKDMPNFDGVYRYVDAPAKLCAEEFGRIKIENDKFHGLENDCLLNSPRYIPEINAVLFDAVCTGEGMEDRISLALKPSEDGGLYGIYSDWIVEWVRCQ